jgi:catalase
MPLASNLPIPEFTPSPALSLLARPGQTGIQTRKVAILVADGVVADDIKTIYADLLKEGAVPRLVGMQLGKISADDKSTLDVEISLEAGPSVLYDAVIIPDGEANVKNLMRDANALDFVRQQYRHCKAILVIGSGVDLLAKADVPTTLPDGGVDESLLIAESVQLKNALTSFKTVLAGHRSFERETNPPKV